MNELDAEMHEAQKEVVAAFAAVDKAQAAEDKALRAFTRYSERSVVDYKDLLARGDDYDTRVRESLEAEVRLETAKGEVSLCIIDGLLDSMGQPRLDR